MARTTKTITFSLPPETAKQIEELMKEEGMTKSELLREALRRYIEDQKWKRILKYGEKKAREMGIKEEDVERLIDEHREEARKT